MKDLLQIRNAYKSFAGVQALNGVNLSIGKGETHCLVGENGCGKSTLIKIISGVVQADSGEIFHENRKLEHVGPAAMIARGVQVIYQDLSLFPNLTVAENIAISELIERRRPLIGRREVREIAIAAMNKIDIQLPLDAQVGDLPIGLQQLVAICRALTRHVNLLVLDEPTSALPKRDIDRLLATIRGLRANGISGLFVSHKLNEIFEVADWITVLRDGESVGTMRGCEMTEEKLLALMSGKRIEKRALRRPAKPGRMLLEVRGLSKRRNFKDISFSLRSGEIVGITGLIGSGRTELALALFGVSPAETGEIVLEGRPVRISSVRDAVRAGIAYVPENRLREGLIMRQSVGDNLVAAILGRLRTRTRLLDREKYDRNVRKWLEALTVKAADPAAPVQTLSGGNQQRVVIGKWLATQPKVLILSSPTAGIDVIAKREIHGVIREQVSGGMGVLLLTDEVSEVVAECDRVLVMRSGRLCAELAADGCSVEHVQKLMEAEGGTC